MKTLTLCLAGCGAAILLGLAPWSAANAQSDTAPAVSAVHGDWTLGQREDWLSTQMDKSLANGSLDRAEFNRARLEMDHLRQEESRTRHDGGGQLTPNQNSEFEARLDTMAAKIHWANMTTYTRPW